MLIKKILSLPKKIRYEKTLFLRKSNLFSLYNQNKCLFSQKQEDQKQKDNKDQKEVHKGIKKFKTL